MHHRTRLIVALLAGLAFASVARAESEPPADTDTIVVVGAVPPAPVPIVPVPPAVVGTALSVLLSIGLRYSKHRKWITLR